MASRGTGYGYCLPLVLCLWLAFPALAGDNDGFIGSQACAGCHQQAYRDWLGSHHDLAMQAASERTVLGDFDDREFNHYGTTSTFFRDGERYLVRTDGADGDMRDFEIKFTFGVEPLQQYLVELDGGRLQALGIAWDSRPRSEGGQRWFHLYPDDPVTHDDVLHWTRPSQNWNQQCAECHSTNLQKNYDPKARRFDTTWSEVNVACEACHGPGADHQAWATRADGWQSLDASRGLQVALDERRNAHWTLDVGTGIARRSRPRESAREIETCARCHSRRSAISGAYRHGEPLLDHYLPRLLNDGLYHADGQIDDEVYVYGSFLQSKMHAAGVTCSDCHEPHSLSLRAPGNGVCLQCHQAERFDVSAHHFHPPESPGASCAECHMPTRTYMVVDPRHDHSMRVPRPDLSVTLGTPNACTNCHVERDAEWAAAQVNDWYGGTPASFQEYAPAFSAARRNESSAARLAAIARDAQAPAIARATALSHIGPYLDNRSVSVIELGLADADAMVRAATVGALASLPPRVRVQFAFPMLRDPVRAVRIEAARVLATIPVGELPSEQRRQLNEAGKEYVAAQLANAERPEAQTNLGNYYAGRGERMPAINAYRAAIELAPYYLPAYVNLADFYRRLGQERDALELLQRAVTGNPDSAAARHALGLSLVRLQRYDEALIELSQAARLDPDDAGFAYVYAVALHSLGEASRAIEILEQALQRHPRNREILSALVNYLRDAGDVDAAQQYAKRLRALSP